MSGRHSVAVELSELGKLARELSKLPAGAGESSAARALIVRGFEKIDKRLTALEEAQNAAIDEKLAALRVSLEYQIRSVKRNK